MLLVLMIWRYQRRGGAGERLEMMMMMLKVMMMIRGGERHGDAVPRLSTLQMTIKLSIIVIALHSSSLHSEVTGGYEVIIRVVMMVVVLVRRRDVGRGVCRWGLRDVISPTDDACTQAAGARGDDRRRHPRERSFPPLGGAPHDGAFPVVCRIVRRRGAPHLGYPISSCVVVLLLLMLLLLLKMVIMMHLRVGLENIHGGRRHRRRCGGPPAEGGDAGQPHPEHPGRRAVLPRAFPLPLLPLLPASLLL